LPVTPQQRKESGIDAKPAKLEGTMTQQPPDPEATKAINAEVADEFRANDGKVGAFDGNPSWVHNLRANPYAHIELGTVSFDVTARELPPAERAEIIPKLTVEVTAFADYQSKTSRVIPIFELAGVEP
jgi:deazaflavin-dependent oxidoreductase (nitroreductase family)